MHSYKLLPLVTLLVAKRHKLFEFHKTGFVKQTFESGNFPGKAKIITFIQYQNPSQYRVLLRFISPKIDSSCLQRPVISRQNKFCLSSAKMNSTTAGTNMQNSPQNVLQLRSQGHSNTMKLENSSKPIVRMIRTPEN